MVLTTAVVTGGDGRAPPADHRVRSRPRGNVTRPARWDAAGELPRDTGRSFLPAFIGAGPYAKAEERGVKLVGATAHHVTEDLDEGPVIEQDVVRVTHADTAADLRRRGAGVERAVLSRAVLWHAEDRGVRHGNHTIAFTWATRLRQH